MIEYVGGHMAYWPIWGKAVFLACCGVAATHLPMRIGKPIWAGFMGLYQANPIQNQNAKKAAYSVYIPWLMNAGLLAVSVLMLLFSVAQIAFNAPTLDRILAWWIDVTPLFMPVVVLMSLVIFFIGHVLLRSMSGAKQY